MEPASHEPLYRLLLSLFTGDDFRRFLAFGPEGDAIRGELPEPPAPNTALVFAGIAALGRRGYLDAALFARLAAEFPGRVADIDKVAAATYATALAFVDLGRYLSLLLGEVDALDITGISSRAGRSRAALRRPIEELYIPLWTRQTGKGSSSERVELSALLERHDRLLVEGGPGSGKTTFVKLVACMLARDRLAIPGADERPWRVGYLGLDGASVPAIPGLVRLSLLVPLMATYSITGRADDRAWLLDLLAARSSVTVTHTDAGLREPGHRERCQQWDRWLHAGEAMLLLDGLDEIADDTLRERVCRVLRDACESWPRCRILLTSRPVEAPALRAMGFHTAVIEPLGPAEIQRFVERWAKALFDLPTHERGVRQAASILRAIAARRDLQHLASTPVLLTCLCVVHWNEGSLPEGRTRVYRAVLSWMLASRDEQRRAAGFSRTFAEYALTSLALAMVRAPTGKQATIGLLDAVEAVDPVARRKFPNLPTPERRDLVRRWLSAECTWSQMIQEVGHSQLRFWHLTMQDFAAALELALRDNGDDDPEHDWWPVVREHLEDPQCRDMIEFFPACLHDEGGMRRVDLFFTRVLAGPEADDLPRAAATVGMVDRLLAVMRAYDYSLREPEARRLATLHATSAEIFTQEGAARVAVGVRIAVAEALGSRGVRAVVRERFAVVAGHAIKLAVFPVTVEDYGQFIDDQGYTCEALWEPQGWSLRNERSWQRPRDWEVQCQHPARPVVEVSWYEAAAYCRWASDRSGVLVRLPTCAEWESAASPDRRVYPWGDAPPTAELANFNRSVGRPSPVGIYPAAVGAFGHHELAGNVWEWCLDGPPSDEELHPRGPGRWLKGGSWWQRGAEALAGAARASDRAGYRHFDRGFRLAALLGT